MSPFWFLKNGKNGKSKKTAKRQNRQKKGGKTVNGKNGKFFSVFGTNVVYPQKTPNITKNRYPGFSTMGILNLMSIFQASRMLTPYPYGP